MRRTSTCHHRIARWRSTKVVDITLCSILVYELRHGAESSADPPPNTESSTYFLRRFVPRVRRCLRSEVCRDPTRARTAGEVIGPHDLQIAAIALHHNLTLVTHNTREFGRIPSLRLDDWES